MTPTTRRTTDELYDAPGGPFYAVHYNGIPYAKFSGANEVRAFWKGLDADGKRYFHIEDAAGKKVVRIQGSLGHAFAILEALHARDEEAEA